MLIVSSLNFPKISQSRFNIKYSTAKSLYILIHFVFYMTVEFHTIKQDRKEKVSWDLEKKETVSVQYHACNHDFCQTYGTFTLQKR